MTIDSRQCTVSLVYPDGRVIEFGPDSSSVCRVELVYGTGEGHVHINGEAIPVKFQWVQEQRPDAESELRVTAIQLLINA